MKQRLSVQQILPFAFVLSATLSLPAYPNKYVASQLLVKFTPNATVGCRDSALSHISGAIVDSLKLIDYYKVGLADTSVLASVAYLQSCHCVLAAQTNGLAPADSFVAILQPNDSLYSTLHYLHNTGQLGGTAGADIDAEGGWNFVHDASNITIAILDTGIDYYHSDLNMWTNEGESGAYANDNVDNDSNGYVDDYYGFDFVDGDGAPYDSYSFGGHGTGTAGRAAAKTNNTIGKSGVAWGAEVMALRVVNQWAGPHNVASEDSMILAVEYAVNHAAKVLNVSLYWGDSTAFGPAFDDAFIAAGNAGLVITCGAGNFNRDNDQLLPLPSTIDAPGLISVAGTNKNDELVSLSAPCLVPGYPTYISNYGATTVDLAAPSCSLMTMYTNGNYNYGSGTSASAPQVAGAAALLFAQNPTWTNVQVKNRILATIDTLASCVGKMVAPGRLNLDRALDNVRPSTISDLTVESIGKNSQAISWTDTGDDSTWGQARAYTLKRSTSPITTDAQFTSAFTVAAGTPGTAGTTHCIEVDGLSSCTTYYWAVKLEDNAFNISTLNSSVSATTACSGFSAAICPEWFVAEGGDGGGGGGGGESALSAPFESASFGLGLLGKSSRPRLASESEERYGWMPENSLRIASSEPGSGDLLQMQSLLPNANGDYRVRLVALGSEGVDLSSVKLGVVDVPDGSMALTAGSSVVTGEAVNLACCVSREGQDVTALYGGGGGSVQDEGEAITAVLPEREGARLLAVRYSGRPTTSDAAGSGLEVQVRAEGGEWSTAAHLVPRRQAETVGIDPGTGREIRMIALGPVHIDSLFELVGATAAEPTWLDVRSVEGTAAPEEGGTATVLEQADDLALLFAGSAQAEETHRSLFLQVAARHGSGLRASTSAVAGELSFVLKAMRPNPAVGRVTVDYVMACEADVSIRVYNVAGRLVRNLASGVQAAGARSAVWDGRDDAGAVAGKGVYFVRMAVPGWTSQRKMILLSGR